MLSFRPCCGSKQLGEIKQLQSTLAAYLPLRILKCQLNHKVSKMTTTVCNTISHDTWVDNYVQDRAVVSRLILVRSQRTHA